MGGVPGQTGFRFLGRRRAQFWVSPFAVVVLVGVVLAGIGVGIYHQAGGLGHEPAQAAPTLFPAWSDGKWGYIDERGDVVLKPPVATTGVFQFSEGLVVANLPGSGFCYLDVAGEIAIPGPFARAEAVSQGRAVVGVADDSGNITYGCIDEQGNWVVEPRYAEAGSFSDGRALVGESADPSDPYGFIDLDGKLAIPEQFYGHSLLSDFSEGLALVAWVTKENGNSQTFQGYIDASGKRAIELHSSVQGEEEEGPQLITPLDGFSENLAPVAQGEKCGYIDRSGGWAIEPEFVMAGSFSEGLAPVATAGTFGHPQGYGYVNKSGRFLIQPGYDFAQPFNGGVARVTVEEDGMLKHLYIDKTGKILGENDASFPDGSQPAEASGGAQ